MIILIRYKNYAGHYRRTISSSAMALICVVVMILTKFSLGANWRNPGRVNNGPSNSPSILAQNSQASLSSLTSLPGSQNIGPIYDLFTNQLLRYTSPGSQFVPKYALGNSASSNLPFSRWGEIPKIPSAYDPMNSTAFSLAVKELGNEVAEAFPLTEDNPLTYQFSFFKNPEELNFLHSDAQLP